MALLSLTMFTGATLRRLLSEAPLKDAGCLEFEALLRHTYFLGVYVVSYGMLDMLLSFTVAWQRRYRFSTFYSVPLYSIFIYTYIYSIFNHILENVEPGAIRYAWTLGALKLLNVHGLVLQCSARKVYIVSMFDSMCMGLSRMVSHLGNRVGVVLNNLVKITVGCI